MDYNAAVIEASEMLSNATLYTCITGDLLSHKLFVPFRGTTSRTTKANFINRNDVIIRGHGLHLVPVLICSSP